MKPNVNKQLKLTHEFLVSILKYEPNTGNWFYSKNRTIKRIGDKAGVIKRCGYRYIRINGIYYTSARLAYFYMNKKWPELYMDHINRIRDDNRWCNLREVSKLQNNNNKSKYKKRVKTL